MIMYEEDELLAILEEFRQSWDMQEALFLAEIDEHDDKSLIPLLQLIRELRALGYDERFRAANFGHMFQMSRTIKPNFENDMVFVSIQLSWRGYLRVDANINQKLFEIIVNPPFAVNQEITILLEMLNFQPIE
jgi:hypothetical protein